MSETRRRREFRGEDDCHVADGVVGLKHGFEACNFNTVAVMDDGAC